MIGLIVDMGVLWLLLNIFSEENWDDEKLKVFLIVIAIGILGGLAAGFVATKVDPWTGLGAYFLVGTACLWGLASLEFRKALAAMGIFMAYKFIESLVFSLSAD